ncbi:MAG: DUF4386 domain-containing protein [Parvularcula sp.]
MLLSELRKVGVTPNFARLTGVVYFFIALAGGSAYFLVSETLIIPGDALQTADNILDNVGMLRVGVIEYLLTLVLDLLMAWMMFRLFSPTHRQISLLAAGFRLAYVFIHGAAVLNLLTVLDIAEGGIAAFPPEYRNGMILMFSEAHLDGFMFSLAFFGVHLLLIGYLAFASGYIPRLLGLLLFVAGLAYIVDTAAMISLKEDHPLLPKLDSFVTISAIVGEIGFLFFLLIKGINGKKQA